MIRFLSLLVFVAFSAMFVSGCSSYTIERANVEIKKVPQPHTDKEEHDEDEEPGNSEFGHSHKKDWSKKKYEEKKENKENKKEHEDD